jgi:hypothetical protein
MIILTKVDKSDPGPNSIFPVNVMVKTNTREKPKFCPIVQLLVSVGILVQDPVAGKSDLGG